MVELYEKDKHILAKIKVKRVDVSNADDLNAMLSKVDNSKDLLLDVSELNFIDSSGIGIIVGLYKRYMKVNKIFGLIGLSDRVCNILKIVGLVGVLKLFNDEGEYLRGKK
jgi:anti-sigma B factor antagonist